MNAIECKNLSKIYKSQRGMKDALTNVSLNIKEGSFFAILGPNGAGKSTLINIVSSLVFPSNGSVSIFGKNIAENVEFAKLSIGTAVQDIMLDPFLTVSETLEYQAGYYGIAKSKRKTDELMAHLELTPHADKKSRMLSGGMKRRLVVGKALVHNPKIVILDEPTAGVDIEIRQKLWSYITKLNNEGVTIILTTHYLEEAQILCDEIAFINNGSVILNDKKEKILAITDRRIANFKINGDANRLLQILEKKYKCKIEDGNFIIEYQPSCVSPVIILDEIRANGGNVTDFSTKESSLEDIFNQIAQQK